MLQTDFDKPDKEKVFHVESRSLGVTQIELSQHNMVQITKHSSKDGCYCIAKVLMGSCIRVLQERIYLVRGQYLACLAQWVLLAFYFIFLFKLRFFQLGQSWTDKGGLAEVESLCLGM